MRQAAALGGAQAPAYSNTILASQRYEVQSSGSGIDFNPKDPLYAYVTNQMKATVAFAQLDPGVATFLSDGLKYAYATSTGWWFPSINAISVLANFKYPGPTTVHLADPTSSNNAPVNWATYPFTRVNCWPLPNYTCTGTIQIDPVPYAEPGQYYDTTSKLVGTQSNPFSIVSTLYGVLDHQSQWATRTVNGVQEWGVFTPPVTRSASRSTNT